MTSEVRDLSSEFRDLSSEVRDLSMKVEREALEKLFINPVYHVASSGSSRSPRPAERVDLKIKTIEYYGLWASNEVDRTKRMVYTMLPASDAEAGAPIAVPFRDAILSHIWPSSGAPDAASIAKLLNLAEGFHVQPRNFLILQKDAEKAFDEDVLLLLPAKSAVRSRLFKSSAAFDMVALQRYVGRELFLPKRDDGCVPFTRLLAWKAVSAIRTSVEDADASADLPSECELDTSPDDGATLASVVRMRAAGFGFKRNLASADAAASQTVATPAPVAAAAAASAAAAISVGHSPSHATAGKHGDVILCSSSSCHRHNKASTKCSNGMCGACCKAIARGCIFHKGG